MAADLRERVDPAHGVFLHTRISFEQLSPAWSEMPVTEFRPSPLGMIYITTRRVGDLAWVRINDIILPNPGADEKPVVAFSLLQP